MKKKYYAYAIALLIVLAIGLGACAKKTFSINVIGGSASESSAKEGTVITLTLDDTKTPIGKAFHHWESEQVEINGDTFTMPAANVTVRPVYDGTYAVSVVGGAAVSEAQYREKVKLTVDLSKVPAGKEFERWETDDSNVTIDTHYLSMPAKDITVRAKYRDIVGPSYRITYITNVEKDSLISHSFVLPNQIPVRPMDVEMAEHHILSWYRDEKYTQPFSFESPLTFSSLTSVNFTLYAKWSITVYESGDFKYGIDNETNNAVITGLTEAGRAKSLLTVPNTVDGRKVTMIGGYSFKNAAMLETLVIPEGVTLIGDNAFYNCAGLKTVTIPSTVTEIGYYAFRGCSALEAFTLPAGLKELREGAFSNCTSLKTVAIPEKVEVINENTFEFCVNLTSATIGAGVKRIGSQAFYFTALTSLVIPGNVKVIGESAFAKCGLLTSVRIGAAEFIGSGAFKTQIPDEYYAQYGFASLSPELGENAEYKPLHILFENGMPANGGYSVFGYDTVIYTDAETLPNWASEFTGQTVPAADFATGSN